jgi:hypothetical protein
MQIEAHQLVQNPQVNLPEALELAHSGVVHHAIKGMPAREV